MPLGAFWGFAMNRLLGPTVLLLSVNAVLADGPLSLHNAATRGDVESVQLHLEQGADPNVKDSSKFTPLHTAARRGDVEIAQLLLDNGANPNANKRRIRPGRTPLHIALEHNQAEVVRVLLEGGADANAKAMYGMEPRVPLEIAIRNGNTTTARLLLDDGAKTGFWHCAGCKAQLERLEKENSPRATAVPTTKRRPKNALEDINRVGNRDVTGIINLFSLRQEIQVGRKFSYEVNKRIKTIDDPVIWEYVNRIGQNLAKNSDVKVPLEIKVVHDETINAFALPGGFFYVNSGLIQFARDEAELAGVMGHEIAHIAGRHGTRQVSQAQLIATTADALIQGFGGDNWGTLIAVNAANIALPLTFLKFSRTFEKKADFLGMQYLYKTGYDPLAMVAFFERLTARETERKGAITAAFSSHPLSRNRAMLLQKAIDELLPDQPAYAITGSEFEEIKARISKLYGGPTDNPERSAPPEILRRLLKEIREHNALRR